MQASSVATRGGRHLPSVVARGRSRGSGEQLAPGVIGGLAAALLSLSLPCPSHAAMETYSLAPIEDFAKVVPKEARAGLEAQLERLELVTGYKVRVLTQFKDSAGGRQNSNVPTSSELKVGWDIRDDLNDHYVVIFVDPSAPNVLGFSFSKAVQVEKLPRPFFTELQSRYGNLFYVRDNGEYSGLRESINALDVCLRKEDGCLVPPGLPSEQYSFTLLCSVIGGGILGASLRLDPVGFVRRRWVYGLLFSPLWFTLSISYGLGPVLSRTDDVQPVIINLGATALAAAIVGNYKAAAEKIGLSVSGTIDDDQ